MKFLSIIVVTESITILMLVKFILKHFEVCINEIEINELNEKSDEIS